MCLMFFTRNACLEFLQFILFFFALSNLCFAEELTDDIVRARFDRWRTSIQTLSLQGEMKGRTAATPSGHFRVSRQHYAAMHGFRFAESQHLSDGFAWEEDMGWARVYIRPDEMQVFWIINRICQKSKRHADVSLNPKLLDTYNGFYLQCTGWWPEEDNRADEEYRYLLANPIHLLLYQTEVEILPDTELVDGRDCIVMRFEDKETTNVMWLDPDRSCTLVQRHQSNWKKQAHTVIHNSDFREVAPGTWLPWKVSRITHRGESPTGIPNDESEILAEATLRINRMAINSADESDFRFTPQQGTITVDIDSGKTDFSPGGLEMLEDILQVANKLVENGNTGGSSGIQSLWSACFAATAIAAGFVLRMRK